jgi:DNA-binding LytR/AlgR family response regulator
MKAVILEDEMLIARELRHKIALAAPDVEILEHLDSLEAARPWLRQHPMPDLFFMDIQLGDGVSFELFQEFSIDCPVVFTTAYDEYAIQAIRVNGSDYLLKPIDQLELHRAIEKCRRVLESQKPYPNDVKALLEVIRQQQAPPKYKEKFIVNFRKQWTPISTKEIAVFYRDNLNYLITFGGDRHILDFTTLEEIESLVDPHLYYRASRQAIIHIDSIRSAKPLDNQTIQLYLKPPMDKLDISVGRAKAPEFRKWFDR